MNARAEMPNWEKIVRMLEEPENYNDGSLADQADRLRAWLAAQPLAPEGGGGISAIETGFMVDDVAAPPAPARDPIKPDPYLVLEGTMQHVMRGLGRMAEYSHSEDGDGCEYIGGYLEGLAESLKEAYDALPELRMAKADAAVPHPAAGAVVVDDQMVKVAMEAYEAGDPWADIPTFCGMRAALTAAIGGAG